MSDPKVTSLGFSPDEQALLTVLGSVQHAADAVSLKPQLEAGTGETVFLSCANPQFSPDKFSFLQTQIPALATMAVMEPSVFQSYQPLASFPLSTVLPPLSTVPPSFLKLLNEYLGGPDTANVLTGFAGRNAKRLDVATPEAWTQLREKMKQFLTRFSLSPERIQTCLDIFTPYLGAPGTAFETLMDADFFMAGVVLPSALLPDVIRDEVTFGARQSPAPRSTPDTTFARLLLCTDFLCVRRVGTETHVAIAYFLKKQPPFTGYCIKLPRPASDTAFATIDPSAIAKVPEPAAAAPLPGGVDPAALLTQTNPAVSPDIAALNNLLPGDIPVPAAAPAINTGGEKSIADLIQENEHLKAELTALQAQHLQATGTSGTYITANKILGEELKRLMRLRKEPSSDEELRVSRAQLEIKVKKLLLRVTQYDATLRDTSANYDNSKKQLEQAAKERKDLEDRLRSLQGDGKKAA